MSKLIYFATVSLDGYIARPDGSLDWAAIDEEFHTFVNARHEHLGAYLYGRRMYELMVAAWPSADADPAAPPYVAAFAEIWRRVPKVVFSQTLDRVDWNARLVKSDAMAEIVRLKAAPGGDLMIGGVTLAAAVHQRGLVDEYQLFVMPVVLGRGLRLFPEVDRQVDLALAESRVFTSGAVFLRYARLQGGEHV